MRNAVKLASAVWAVGPLPLILTSAAFIKMDRGFVAPYAFGWLVKPMIVLAGWFLHWQSSESLKLKIQRVRLAGNCYALSCST